MKASLDFICASSKACCGVCYQNNFFGSSYFFFWAKEVYMGNQSVHPYEIVFPEAVTKLAMN